MNVYPGLLDDGLRWLGQASLERWSVEEAHRQLATLRAEHPGLEVQLAWEPEAFSGQVHYDLLVTLPDCGTVSLSFAADDGLPWALRNAHSAPEGYVLRVNGRYMSVSTLMTSLDLVWGDAGMLSNLVDMLIIEGLIVRWDLDPNEGTRAEAVRAFWREHGIGDGESLERFLFERGISSEQLEDRLASAARRAAVRAKAIGSLLPEWWEQHHSSLDSVRIARIGAASREEAAALAAAIRAGGTTLLAEAQHRFLASDNPQSDPVFTTFRRRDLSEVQMALLFGQPAAAVVVVPSAEAWAVVQILGEIPATRDPQAKVAAEALVFEEWLAEQRRKAAITWFWGRWEPKNAG